ncbi:NUDIX domain-containing protein [Halocalculus aciditolerans]|nr:NUDIX domain-containing protein [Halocalculus aciditolerans]
MDEVHVVTCFLRSGVDVLLLKRSERVGSYRGRWGAPAGHAEGRPDEQAWREIAEETGLADACERVRVGDPFDVVDEDRGTRWVVHPYLFDCARRDVEPNEETTEWAWAQPTAIRDRETVPDLWRSWRAVAPTVESVADDDTHGSAYVSLRAVEVLRDAAAEGAGRARLEALARDLLDAKPGMAAVRNRVNRVLSEAAGGKADARAVAERTLDAAVDADGRAADRARDLVAGERVVTLSRSGTVLDALTGEPGPASVVVAESRPACEGVGVAEALADAGVDVALTTDANLPGVVAGADVVLVGADTVLPDGRVLNKVGTRAAALAAEREDAACYAVCARDKVSPNADVHVESGDSAAVYDGERDVAVENPLFDVAPADCVTGVVTEDGVLDATAVGEVAGAFRSLAAWQDEQDDAQE